jgi:pyrroloquinoline quinone (PQQ) biosynthesis protein C
MQKSRLSERIDNALYPYRAEYNRIVNPWLANGAFGATYPALVTETYHYVKHSCELMELAREKTDPKRTALRSFWDKHIKEEFGHEEWALNDLVSLGYNRVDILKSDPLSETIELVGSQMYLIQCVTPVALVGYAYMMESKPPNLEFLKAVQSTYSISPQAMTFLLGHADADIAHAKELRDIVDTLVESEHEARAATSSAVLGLAHINRMLLRIRMGQFLSIQPLPISEQYLDVRLVSGELSIGVGTLQ